MKKKSLLKRILTNFDAVITGTTLTICVVIVNLNVLMRYVLNAPLYWSNEFVTSLFVWTVFIGSAYAYRKHAHLGVDIVVNLFSDKSKERLMLIISIVELMVLIMLTVISAQYVKNLIYVRGVFKPALTDVLRIPKWYTGLAVPVGFGLSVVYSIYFMLTDRLHIIKKKESQLDELEDGVEGVDVF